MEALGSSAALVEGLEPVHPVDDDVQQPLPGGHVVLVSGFDQLPGVPGRVGCPSNRTVAVDGHHTWW